MSRRLRRCDVRTLVLLYHRVAELERDPYRLAVGPERFGHQLDLLRERFELVPLAKVLEPGGAGPRAAITLDDGYRDTAGAARELLEARDMPATVFVVSGAVGSQEGFWWDRLEHLVLDCLDGRPTLDVEIDGRPLRGDVRGAESRARTLIAVYRRVRRLPLPEIERFVSRLAAELGVSAAVPARNRPLSEDELRTLARSELIEIGAHTVSHPHLSRLDRDGKRAEIAGSRAPLEELTGGAVRSFSYPHGDYDAETVRLVEEAGFSRACSSIEGSASPRTRPFLLPRRVVLDWDETELGRRLDAWRDA